MQCLSSMLAGVDNPGHIGLDIAHHDVDLCHGDAQHRLRLHFFTQNPLQTLTDKFGYNGTADDPAVTLFQKSRFYPNKLTMTLIRILIIALVIWLVLRMIKNWANRNQIGPKGNKASIETVVRCHHCGLHIPKHEAVKTDNKYYCSQEHLKLHREGS